MTSEENNMADDMDSMEEMEESDNESVDGAAHQKLINSLFALDGKKNKRQNVALRSSNVANNLDMAVHASKDVLKIQAEDLNLKRKHASVQLQKPLSALETEKTKRKIARETVLTEMTKWEPVVTEIRSASQTVYSNRPHGLQMYQAMKPKTFTPRTPLEQEIYAALGKDECLIKPNQVLTAAETKALKAMSVKEAVARRAELMKHHELLSRMELKAKRQKKIKSKRYHKILQKERVATDKKELEHLKQSNPAAFLEKIDLMEKNRMEERLTLKHKGGGKFSRLHKAYSKFDDRSREAIQAMLEKSKELTKKLESVSDDEDNDDDNEANDAGKIYENSEKESIVDDRFINAVIKGNISKFTTVNTSTNIWLDPSRSNSVNVNLSTNSNVEQKDGEPRNICESLHSRIQNIPTDEKMSFLEQTETLNQSVSVKISETCPETTAKILHKVKDKNVSDNASKKPKNEESSSSKKETATASEAQSKESKKESEKSVTILESADQAATNDDLLKVTMEELFEDEDVMEEFSKEKAEIEGRSVLKVESKLPGWGSWAGPDYKHVQKKKSIRTVDKSNTKKPDKVFEPYVWVNPNKDEGIRKLLPKSVPFPFSSVEQYEKSVCQPVSRGLVPETATKLLTKPEVVTKLGHIIKPLDKEDYLSKETEIDMEMEIKVKSKEFRK